MASQAEQEDFRFAEKRSKFRGSAKVKLKHLDFEVHTGSDSVAAFLDPKNVTRLVQIFGLEGCNRLDLEHRVPVVINAEFLQQSIHGSGVASGDLLKSHIPPELTFPANTLLRCLHGRHRIAAAKAFLDFGNKWWTVDFYSDDLSEIIRRDLREDYANSRNFCDGDIYRQIRYYQQTENQLGEGRWFARLSEGKRKDLRQLQRREDLKSLSQALDRLLPYIGFWPGLQIGTFHRILNLKCSEELVNYLNQIRACWDDIIGQREDLQPCIDYQTVQLLQSLCPKTSALDNGLAIDLMHSGKLFPLISDRDLRSRILEKIQGTEHLIPSLHTFLEDTKWLEPCAKVLRRLLPKNRKSSIHRSLLNCYTGAQQREGTFRVEQRDLSFIERSGSELQASESGYRQIWLFAWRHFPELSATVPRKDVGKPKPRARASNEQCWQQLACLARSLGFDSEEIQQLNKHDPDSRMAFDFLSQARPADSYHMSDGARIARAHEICEVLKCIERQASATSERISEPTADGAIPVDHRYGRPHEHSHTCSKAWFFLSEIYGPQTSSSISQFTVNRDIFLFFFGAESYLGNPKDTSVPDVDRGTEANLNVTQPQDQSQPQNQPEPQPQHQSQSQNQPEPQPQHQSQSQNQPEPQPQHQNQPQSQPQSQFQQEHSIPNGESENTQTQTVDDVSALALFNAESVHRPENPDLFERYIEKWEHIAVETAAISDEAGRVLPEAILSRANDHYFNVYLQLQEPGTSALKAIEIKNIYQYVRGSEWDGVIYALGQGVTLEGFEGKSTEDRLRELNRIAKKQPWLKDRDRNHEEKNRGK